jgi:hypothetical protein
MAKKTSKVRLQKELKAFVADPPPFIPRVHVNERNILVSQAPATVVGPDPTPPPPPPPTSRAPYLTPRISPNPKPTRSGTCSWKGAPIPRTRAGGT